MMFPGMDPKTMAELPQRGRWRTSSSQPLAARSWKYEKAAEAGGVVEGSRYARRITALDDGAAHLGSGCRPRTTEDQGRIRPAPRVIGMLNNCAGGFTPWGTVLSAEENFNMYFAGDFNKTPEARNYKRYGFAARSRYAFARFYDRFDVEKEPNEPNRFGWVVEIDPYDPGTVPVKRTALGRFKHESGDRSVNPNGTVTVYSGDDEARDYVYKFVSRGRYDPHNRAANREPARRRNALRRAVQRRRHGRVAAAGFRRGAAHRGEWLHSQADVLIETRRAADLLKATPMDRPEDVEVNPVTGRAYVVLTNNAQRKPEEINRANPRAANDYGHILELIPPGEGRMSDQRRTEHRWEVFLVAGPVDQAGVRRRHLAGGWLAMSGRPRLRSPGPACGSLPIRGRRSRSSASATECGPRKRSAPGRAVTKFFYRTPTGAEMTGPCFTPDDKTLFLSVQHPAADDPGSTFERPSTRWPDFKDDMPPRPSVIAITHLAGEDIGS